MPNHGNLCKDLNGGTLSIKGKLVIDSHRNVYGLGNVSAKNLRVNEDLVVCEIMQKNTDGILILGDVIIGDGFTLTVGNLTATNIFGNVCGDITTDNISAKTGTTINIANNVNVTGNVIATANVESVNVVASGVLCGDIKSDNIAAKTGTTISVANNVNVTGNVIATANIESVNVIASGVLCGNIKSDNIAAKTGGNIAVANNLVVTGFVGVSDAYRVNNVQVVGAQQMDIANISTANIFGTATDDLQEVGNTATVGVDRSLQINNNFADLAIKMNAILDAIRAHGLIG